MKKFNYYIQIKRRYYWEDVYRTNNIDYAFKLFFKYRVLGLDVRLLEVLAL